MTDKAWPEKIETLYVWVAVSPQGTERMCASSTDASAGGFLLISPDIEEAENWRAQLDAWIARNPGTDIKVELRRYSLTTIN